MYFNKLFLILILGVIFSLSSFGANLPPASSVVLGGGAPAANLQNVITPLSAIDTSGVVRICAGTNSGTSSDFYAFYPNSAPATTGQYQVPSGKVFYGIDLNANVTATNDSFQFGYGTAALAAEPTATPPTGVVYYGASTVVATGGMSASSASTTYGYGVLGLNFPALSYPFIKIDAAVGYHVCLTGIVK